MEETGHEPPDAERRARRRSAARLRPEADEAEDRSIVDRWSPFVASDGRELRVSAVLEPVYELRGFTRIGFRMVRQVLVSRTNEELSRAAVANLSAADLLRVDLATLARGVHRLQAESEGAQQLSLIVPLSYASLASQRGRAELARPIREASSRLRCGVICEVTDVEGVPAGALLSAVSLIRPLVLLVAGRLNTPSRAAVDRLAGGGLQAVTIECPTGLSDPEFSAWSSEVVAAGRRLVKSIIVFGVASTGRTAELAYRGATHASLTRGWQGSDPD